MISNILSDGIASLVGQACYKFEINCNMTVPCNFFSKVETLPLNITVYVLLQM